jgi:hypothetical protein
MGGLVGKHSDRAMRDVRRRRYSCNRLFNDTVEFWAEAADGWWAAMQGANRAVPTIVFDIDADTESATRVVPVFGPSLPYGTPKVVFLRLLEGAKSDITVNNCYASFVSGGRELKVALVNLVTHLSGPSVRGSFIPTRLNAPAVYEGLIALHGEPLAMVYIDVACIDETGKSPSNEEKVVASRASDRPRRRRPH